LIISIIKIFLTGSPHHKKVDFSGALHKINNKYDKNYLKVKVKNRGCKKLKLKNEYKKFLKKLIKYF